MRTTMTKSATMVSPLAAEIEAAVRAAAPATCENLPNRTAKSAGPLPVCRVLDVVIVEPNQWWVGAIAS